MSTILLILNAGSSSLKFSLFAAHAAAHLKALQRGEVTGLGNAARWHVEDGSGRVLRDAAARGISRTNPHTDALDQVLNLVDERGDGNKIHAVGHRVVHGGDRYAESVKIDARVLADLHELTSLAPLHQPQALAAIEALTRRDATLTQIACFDSAFHQTQPDIARRFGLPRALHDAGVKRYGFHGLSYEYIAGVLPDFLGARADGRVIVAHLGNGASLCALRERKSVATTMGFTPLDGLIMGTRCGALDPGVVLHLLRSDAMTIDHVEALLHHESGLLGVSGISADMRALLASNHPHAQEAVALFSYRVAREIGSMAAALSGVDALIFTGGIGEHAPVIREAICRACEWLGVRVDPQANAAGTACITIDTSPVSAWVIPTHEDEMMAHHVFNTLPR